MQETHCNIGMVAGSDASDHSTCAELQSMRQREQTRKGTVDESELLKYPWQVVGTDLFELNKLNYLLVVDYFSRYPVVLQLTSTTSMSVISALKSVFSRHAMGFLRLSGAITDHNTLQQNL